MVAYLAHLQNSTTTSTLRYRPWLLQYENTARSQRKLLALRCDRVHWQSGKQFHGPRLYSNQSFALAEIPFYARLGSIIPLRANESVRARHYFHSFVQLLFTAACATAAATQPLGLRE